MNVRMLRLPDHFSQKMAISALLRMHQDIMGVYALK